MSAPKTSAEPPDPPPPPIVLVIAGSDSGGGAGIQADLKTVMALGGFATTALTAVTSQNTQGVKGVRTLPAQTVSGQIAAILEDIGADAVKTGMLATAEIVDAVTDALPADIPLVIDPVMSATSGDPLAERGVGYALRKRLFARATLLTPNVAEAAALTGLTVKTVEDQVQAGAVLLEMGAKAVLVKGGDAPGDHVTDVLLTEQGETRFEATRLPGGPFHGTGCTLASAIAVYLARRDSLETAITQARAFVRGAIAQALPIGAGAKPLHPGWAIHPRPAWEP